MPRILTPEQRRARAEIIRRHKPWLKSTGPRTAAGKAVSRMNNYRHGLRSAGMRRFVRALRRHRIFLKMINERWKQEHAKRIHQILTYELSSSKPPGPHSARHEGPPASKPPDITLGKAPE